MREHGIGAVVHFAGKIQVGESVRDPSLYFDHNVVRSLALLNAMRDEGVPNILFSSSAAVYDNARTVLIPESSAKERINPYGATKLVFEFALDAWQHAYGFHWSALRYFNAAGAHPDGTIRENHKPKTHLIPLAIDAALGAAPALRYSATTDTPDGTCVRDDIHVNDLASAHLASR
jgi:UDP-glucose 4-epimerase